MNGGTDPILYCTGCHQHLGLLKNNSFTTGATHNTKECNGTLKVHRPIYAGVFLTEHSKQHLLRKVPPRHRAIYAEHVTLGFGRHLNEMYPIGEFVRLRAGREFADERGQCISVEIPWGHRKLFWKGQTPHVTISCADGIKPFYSNDLMKKVIPTTILNVDFVFEGVVDYFPRIKN